MKFFSLLFFIFLFSCSTVSVDRREEMLPPQKDAVTPTLNKSIVNFQVVEDGIYRSGRPDASFIHTLAKDYGIKTIISLETYAFEPNKGHEEKEAAKKAGIVFLHIPMSPVGEINKEKLKEAIKALHVELRPILVHCYRGSERTGMVVGGYRMLYNGWSYERTEQEMDLYGFNNSLFKGWKKELLNLR